MKKKRAENKKAAPFSCNCLIFKWAQLGLNQ